MTMFHKTTLKNGLRIIAVPQENTEAITVLVLVATGSKYEKKEINGISHFLEHMFFKGTRKRPSTIDVAESLDKVGGIYNAFTGEEYTGYFAKVDAVYLDLALDWVSDIYFNSLLPEKEIKKEKGIIIEEINMYQDNPMSYVGVLWSKLLYGDQPAGRPICGTKESVTAISRRDLISYWKNQYVGQNTIVCLAGKIRSLSVINERIKRYFSKIKTSQSFKKSGVFEGQSKPQCLLFQKKTDQTHLCLGVRTFNLFHPQRYALEIMATILGGMTSSRLFIEVREKMGVAYYIRTSNDSDTDTGFLVTQVGIDNKRVDESISVILREYKKISQKKVPYSELKKAKDYLKGRMALFLETSDAQALFYGAQELLEKKILNPKEICQKIEKVSQNDILKTAKDIFQPQKLNLALIGPFKEETKFQKLLKI